MSGTAPQQPRPGGMQRIPFPTESYQHPSKPLSSKWLSNMMAEQEPADARTQAALIPTPGLSINRRVGAGPIHAMNDDLPGRIYIVSGTHFYRLIPQVGTFPDFTVEDLGDIGTPATGVLPDYVLMYTIACSATAAVVCVPPNAFTCSHNPGSPLNQISGDTWPGAQSVAAHDGYHIFVSYENSAKFFISYLLDPTSYDALDFAYTDGLPNVLRRVFPYRSDLWMMGEGGIEIWYDAGSSGLETTPGISFFPYRRRSGGVIPFALASPQSVAAGDGSIFWLSHNQLVFKTAGYQANRISTHAIEDIIRDLNPYNLVSAFTYTEVGHVFYVMNWADRTLVYDCATKQWHDRSSDGGRWRPNATAHPGTLLWFGDIQSGDIFSSEVNSLVAGLEDTDPVERTIVFPPLFANTNRAFCSRFEVEMESGDGRIVDGEVTLDWSDDGGFTFNGGPRVMSAQVAAYNRRQRVFTTRLGSFRQRVFRLRWSGAATIYAANAEITGGAS